ncbi:hypothetical protein [Cellulophaga tyrosinoxydans]|uniref:Uncharacterized protein n=1 Tax=Cellulophaga tyrosinoxydans TaxID=504486 RepID=A0A1W2CSF8_9FLAO|nr:hypothetical protein [Cellulophaga tyrosinoxydans]SMC87864.1 hypothetical protein SAMN05660703_3159 [Cellulophaga tyrosinoxydans]
MKNILLIILISFFTTDLSAQNLLDVALAEKSLIVNEKPAKPKLPFFILYEKEFFNGKNKSDSLNVRELMSKVDTLDIDYSKWTKNELKNRIVVSKGKKIDLKKEMLKMSDKPKAEQKKLKKEIKGFNNNKSGWRNYPLSISRPIISNDGKMALITIIRGNSGGSTELYKMENGKWEYFEHLERWAY